MQSLNFNTLISNLERLTPREFEAFIDLGNCLSIKEAASKSGHVVTPKTIESQRTNFLKKLDIPKGYNRRAVAMKLFMLFNDLNLSFKKRKHPLYFEITYGQSSNTGEHVDSESIITAKIQRYQSLTCSRRQYARKLKELRKTKS